MKHDTSKTSPRQDTETHGFFDVVSSGSATGHPAGERRKTRGKLRDNPRYLVTRLLALRPRSVADVRRYLQKKGRTRAEAESVIAEYLQNGLLDDRAFARQLCESFVRGRPLGPRLVRARLKAHGLPAALIEEVLRQTLPPERELAQRALDAKRASLQRQHLDPRVRRERAGAYLLRRGFSPHIVGDLLSRGSGEDAAP